MKRVLNRSRYKAGDRIAASANGNVNIIKSANANPILPTISQASVCQDEIN
jgi:hypothetical protein